MPINLSLYGVGLRSVLSLPAVIRLVLAVASPGLWVAPELPLCVFIAAHT